MNFTGLFTNSSNSSSFSSFANFSTTSLTPSMASVITPTNFTGVSINTTSTNNSSTSIIPAEGLGYCSLSVTKPSRIALTCATLVIFIAAIVGNSVVIYVVKSRRKVNISFNYFIMSMACADLLHASTGIPIFLSFLYAGTLWFDGPFGIFLCKFLPYATVVSVIASITTLNATAIERFLAAKLILKKPVTPKLAQIIVAIIWIYSLLISTNEVIKMNVVIYDNSTPHCLPVLENWVKYNAIDVTCKFVLMYMLPLATMATLYANIIWTLRQHSGSNLQTEQYKNIQRRKRKLTAKLVLITVIFAVCWLPVHINHFLATFHYALHSCISPEWHYISFWLAHANTAINPVLYLLLTKNARVLFKSSVHAAKTHGNGTGSRRSESLRMWMFQRFQSDSRLLPTCVSAQTIEEEEKGHEMKLIETPGM